MIDLEKKSKELKQLVSQYDMSSFLGSLALMMQFIPSPEKTNGLKGLTSPQRQLYYIAGLNLTSKVSEPQKLQFSNEEWDRIRYLLIEIEAGYNEFFYPKVPGEIDEDWKARRRVAMPSFLGYFNTGHLNYEEQEIERVLEYFAPFDIQITNHFGLSINDFVEVYNFIDAIPNQFLDENINHKEGRESWQDFTSRMTAQGIMPDKWFDHMPAHHINHVDFIQDNGKMYRFSWQQLEDKFGSTIAKAFLEALTCERKKSSFLYYTEKNPLFLKPIFKVKNDEYQLIETKQLIHSIYSLLMDFCIKDQKLKEKFYARRGDMLEDKIERIFQTFFKNKATVYKSFYTEKGNEQDLLIIYNGSAFIIEAKASKRDEPRRNPDQAYNYILENFEETIQKGYDQAYRIKDYFLNKQILKLYKDQKLTKHITDIDTKKIYNVFSIVVTLERFGFIQAELFELLEIYENDTYPWSVCIDDLEVFLLTLSKQKKTLANLVYYLNIRQNLHGHLFCSEELEVCGAFLSGKLTMKNSKAEETIVMFPDMGKIFDDYYLWGGLGFKNEKYLNLKTDPKYFRLGIESTKNIRAEKRV